MEEKDLRQGQRYKLVSIEQHKPCKGTCEPCIILSLLTRGFLPGTTFTVEHIIGGNAMLKFESGDVFAISIDHLKTCSFVELD